MAHMIVGEDFAMISTLNIQWSEATPGNLFNRKSRLTYADMLPTKTIDEFLKALAQRFHKHNRSCKQSLENGP